MNLTAGLEKPEVKKLTEAAKEKAEGFSEKAELGNDSEGSEEDGDEESEEEGETSGNQPAREMLAA